MSNSIHIVGHLGKDPELTYFDSGDVVCNFSVADSSKFRNREGKLVDRVTWHQINVWGKQGENCKQYLAKGRQVYIRGELQTREVVDANGNKKVYFQVRAATVDFLDRKNTATKATQPVAQATESEETPLEQEVDQDRQAQLALLDDDIPM